MEPYIDKEELRNIHMAEITKHQELLIVAKEHILTILRDLEPAEARHILNQIRRKYENDEIHDKFFMEEEVTT